MDQVKLKGVREPSVLLLLLLVSFPSVCAVLFTPALPLIASDYHVSTGAAQLAVTLFLVGYALGQLPYGPLSNKIGRKPALYIGLIISLLGSLLCAWAGPLSSFSLLLFARILSAFGAAVGLMMTFTIVSDFYEPALARKKLAFVIVAFAIAPGAAVSLGGFFTELFDWESTFYLQALYSLALLLLCLRLPETSTTLSDEPFTLRLIYDSYVKRCNNKRLIICGLIQGCCTAFVYIFAAKAPFLALNSLHITPSDYGFLNLIPSVGMIIGAVLAHQTSHRFTPQKSVLVGLLLMLPSSLCMLLFFAFDLFNLWTLFVPYFVTNMGLTFAYINCPAIGTGHAKNKPNASAVLGFLNISICVVMILILQSIPSQAPVLMPGLFVALLLILFPLYGLLERVLKQEGAH